VVLQQMNRNSRMYKKRNWLNFCSSVRKKGRHSLRDWPKKKKVKKKKNDPISLKKTSAWKKKKRRAKKNPWKAEATTLRNNFVTPLY